MILSSSKSQRRILLLFTLAICILIMRGVWNIRYANYEFDTSIKSDLSEPDFEKEIKGDHDLPCYNLPGVKDILIVMKTSAVESRKNIPIHLKTTFRCTQNFLIYSDLSETIENHQIYDLFQESDLNGTLQQQFEGNSDFNIYDRIQESKRDNFVPDQDILSELDTEELELLDRWKYLPMLEKSYKYMPDIKWYIYIESSTYLSIPNLLIYLNNNNLESKDSHFIGNRLFFNKIPFASAGSGFLLSNGALATFEKVYREEKGRKQLEMVVGERKEGDVGLAMALMKIGAVGEEEGVLQLWPALQGESWGGLDYTEEIWCKGILTYNQMSLIQIKTLFDFDMSRIPPAPILPTPLLHSEIFTTLIQHHLAVDQHDWDNQSPTIIESDELQEQSKEACWAVCGGIQDCVQAFWDEIEVECRVDLVVRLGARLECGGECVSGWMGDRIQERVRRWGEVCDGEGVWSL